MKNLVTELLQIPRQVAIRNQIVLTKKSTKNVSRAGDVRLGNGKQKPQLQDYNNISQQNLNPPQK